MLLLINVSKTQKSQLYLIDVLYYVFRNTYRLINTNNFFECFISLYYVSVGHPFKPRRTTYFFK